MFGLLALVMSAALAVWGAFNLRYGGGAFLALAYGAGAVTYLAHYVTRPPPRPEFSFEENYLYRRHFVALMLPIGAREISGALNTLRMLGFPWALWFAWKGLWIHAGAAGLLFLFLGPLCLWLAPYLYYGDPASKGDRKAAELLETLQYVAASIAARRGAADSERP